MFTSACCSLGEKDHVVCVYGCVEHVFCLGSSFRYVFAQQWIWWHRLGVSRGIKRAEHLDLLAVQPPGAFFKSTQQAAKALWAYRKFSRDQVWMTGLLKTVHKTENSLPFSLKVPISSFYLGPLLNNDFTLSSIAFFSTCPTTNTSPRDNQSPAPPSPHFPVKQMAKPELPF